MSAGRGIKDVIIPILNTAHRPIGERALRRAIAAAAPPYRVHVGAFRRTLDGWLNTDVSWRNTLHLDATAPWPFPTNSVSHVYSDNVIEHLPLDQARTFLRHAHAAMQSGGIIRSVTPDVERVARMYLTEPDLAAQHVANARQHGYDVAHPVDLLRIMFTTNGHDQGYLWDMQSLSAELLAAGFVDVQRRSYGESPDPVLCDIERPTDALSQQIALVVEARKP